MEIKWIGVSVLTGFFLLELGAMAAVKIILAIATPLVIATLWDHHIKKSKSYVRYIFQPLPVRR
ncbi:hypothetical protein FC701_31365 [Bacillus mycoides]|uniref:Uncharacterized protein n=2 Tax=Bacillus mycoides TaxID=1405 RepID=A0A4U2ZW58_BACMY|nr:hypothetical protein FC701_31365 [Bacillus mycoides]